MGDAAVGMHPVTAHGFNFGLRGVETFAALSAAARDTGLDLGNARLLARYAREHRRATKPLYLFTNGIVRLYTDTRPVARLARTALLQVSNRMDPIKKMLMRQLTAV